MQTKLEMPESVLDLSFEFLFNKKGEIFSEGPKRLIHKNGYVGSCLSSNHRSKISVEVDVEVVPRKGLV
ncbi:hypothetical protein LWI28_011255 [Acer negundo]|uniref:Uncharacterized protein n=1 Tax=Acer negundo TaxID=4023 RepID=A0AAD5NR85_ACENE|nr:hypothetical protein LWI28_011255 [Acer negundo]